MATPTHPPKMSNVKISLPDSYESTDCPPYDYCNKLHLHHYTDLYPYRGYRYEYQQKSTKKHQHHHYHHRQYHHQCGGTYHAPLSSNSIINILQLVLRKIPGKFSRKIVAKFLQVNKMQHRRDNLNI